jgi:hypothetical protein
MDYGTDFLLVDDDIVFTPDGDVEIVSGPRTIAQDIDQELKIVKKRLMWDEEAGSSMPLFLNDTVNDSAIIGELERVAIADPRVDPVSVSAKRRDEKKYRLEFRPVGATTPETLDFDLGTRGEQ